MDKYAIQVVKKVSAPLLTDDLHPCPSQETSCFHLRKREAAIEQAEHEAQFFVCQLLPRLRYR